MRTLATHPSRWRGGREPACRALDDPLTAGHVSLLATLTAGQRAALDRRPGLRAVLLDWFRNGGDRILWAEALRLLSPAGPGP